MPATTPIEISTVGAKVYWAVENATTGAGVKPATGWAELVGVNAAPGFDMTPETIDASDISDYITQYVPGRQDPGGDASFTLNQSELARNTWNNMVTAANSAKQSGYRCWFQYVYPDDAKAYFWSGLPLTLGNGGIEQNALSTIPAHVIPNGAFEWNDKITS